MPTAAIVTLVLVLVAIDLFIVVALFSNLRSTWRSLETKYPPKPIAPGAVRRTFQPFGVGLFNLDRCVHMAVDETHLHIQPVRVLNRLRMGPISVPWDLIAPVTPPGKPVKRIRVGSTTLKGPAWAFSMADPIAADEPAR